MIGRRGGVRHIKPIALLASLYMAAGAASAGGSAGSSPGLSDVRLPAPRAHDGGPLNEAIANRRSHRSFRRGALTLSQVSQLLWAAQGITDQAGRRTAPSAGALYPLEIYLVAGRAEGLEPGVYRYLPRGHRLRPVIRGDRRSELGLAALGQPWVARSAAVLLVAADFSRTTQKYGQRGRRYVCIETGHAAQNVLLEATSLGLGAVTVGAFDDAAVGRIAGLPPNEQPLYLIAIGRISD